MKRITYIIPTLNPGGAEYQTINQIVELGERGYAIQLIILTSQADLIQNIPTSVRVEIVGNDNLKTVNPRIIVEAIRERNKIATMIKSFLPQQILAILPVAHFITRSIDVPGAKKWIYHRSTEYAVNPANSVGKKLFKWLNTGVLAKAEESHLYISQAVKNDIEQNEKTYKGVVLYNAVPEKEISNELMFTVLEKFKLKINNYIVVPGRLHPVKGHIFFLNSLVNIILKNKLTIIFAGGGPSKEKIEKTIQEQKLEEHVFITDFIENENLLALIKGAKFCVIPSLQEGFGNVAVEALMLGKLVLASDAGGLKEIIQNGMNGFLFQTASSRDLEAKFTQLLNGGELNIPLTEKIIASYKERFTTRAQVDKLEELFNY